MRILMVRMLGLGAIFMGAIVAVQPVEGQTFNTIYSFTGGADGGAPFANLLLDQGILYGTTSGGGAHTAGTVFQVDPTTHVETVLHSFAGGPADGAAPFAGLIRDAAGDLCGTTSGGGAHFFGTAFKLSGGVLTLLHSFRGPPTEGSGPAGSLALDDAGNFYGTTYSGGNTTGWGTVFEITAGGVYTTGQSFSPDGALPRAGLVRYNGNLYGTTYGGGAHSYGGTIYEVANSTALYTFSGGADGSQPMDSLISDGQGNLYGTASGGGNGNYGSGHGVIFKFDLTTGQETVLYTFTGPDGSTPDGSLVRDLSGNLYGTTSVGGAAGHGTVFELSTASQLTTLHSFTGGADGSSPVAGLIADAQGNLWGVTSRGGSGGYGTVFEITFGAR
jgi:uncharacterized repeat protein (TIGR03803 family)